MARTWMLVVVGLAAGWGAGFVCGWSGLVARQAGDPAEQRLIRAQQARLVVLQREGDLARAQAAAWAGQCAAAQAEAALLRRTPPAAGSAETLPAAAAEALTGDPIRVLEVNAALSMLVVDAGRARGMRAGMCFGVVHEREPVADVRAVDVREALTGVVIERTYAGKTPVAGDRLVARKK
ncbi:MAG: hypothetical protein NTV49_08630 [Kiritimatiellaeota bacterium]|nr:hypothetical protein [Kiritimatiellota bacterium]